MAEATFSPDHNAVAHVLDDQGNVVALRSSTPSATGADEPTRFTPNHVPVLQLLDENGNVVNARQGDFGGGGGAGAYSTNIVENVSLNDGDITTNTVTIGDLDFTAVYIMTSATNMRRELRIKNNGTETVIYHSAMFNNGGVNPNTNNSGTNRYRASITSGQTITALAYQTFDVTNHNSGAEMLAFPCIYNPTKQTIDIYEIRVYGNFTDGDNRSIVSVSKNSQGGGGGGVATALEHAGITDASGLPAGSKNTLNQDISGTHPYALYWTNDKNQVVDIIDNMSDETVELDPQGAIDANSKLVTTKKYVDRTANFWQPALNDANYKDTFYSPDPVQQTEGVKLYVIKQGAVVDFNNGDEEFHLTSIDRAFNATCDGDGTVEVWRGTNKLWSSDDYADTNPDKFKYTTQNYIYLGGYSYEWSGNIDAIKITQEAVLGSYKYALKDLIARCIAYPENLNTKAKVAIGANNYYPDNTGLIVLPQVDVAESHIDPHDFGVFPTEADLPNCPENGQFKAGVQTGGSQDPDTTLFSPALSSTETVNNTFTYWFGTGVPYDESIFTSVQFPATPVPYTEGDQPATYFHFTIGSDNQNLYNNTITLKRGDFVLFDKIYSSSAGTYAPSFNTNFAINDGENPISSFTLKGETYTAPFYANWDLTTKRFSFKDNTGKELPMFCRYETENASYADSFDEMKTYLTETLGINFINGANHWSWTDQNQIYIPSGATTTGTNTDGYLGWNQYRQILQGIQQGGGVNYINRILTNRDGNTHIDGTTVEDIQLQWEFTSSSNNSINREIRITNNNAGAINFVYDIVAKQRTSAGVTDSFYMQSFVVQAGATTTISIPYTASQQIYQTSENCKFIIFIWGTDGTTLIKKINLSVECIDDGQQYLAITGKSV